MITYEGFRNLLAIHGVATNLADNDDLLNFINILADDFYEEGFIDGKEDAFAEIDIQLSDEWSMGHEEGFDEGHADGLEEGKEEANAVGFPEAYEGGYKDGQLDTIEDIEHYSNECLVYKVTVKREKRK